MESKINKVIGLLFFIAVFLYFMHPVCDVDFPWHLKTGEYIYQHKEIPKTDPFLIFSKGEATEKFFLSQYWLAQLIFYGIYNTTGLFGIVMLRNILIAGVIVILWFSMKNTSNIFKIVILYLTATQFLVYSGERPQLFSFLFSIVVIAILERYRKTGSIKSLFFLPVIMLFWANMHGGYIFGDMVIAIYCLSETMKYFFFKKSAISPAGDRLLLLLAAGFSSIIASYINPNIYQAFVVAIEMSGNPGVLTIREYETAIAETWGPLASKYIFIYWAIVGYSLVLLSLNFKRFDLTHAGLVFFTLYMSLTAIRFAPFFVMTALFIGGQYRLDIVNLEKFSKLKRLKLPLTIVSLLLVLFWGGSLAYSMPSLTNFKKIMKISYYPEGAVQFLRKNIEGGRIFNSYNTGSYLLWRLYPEFRTFADTRGINGEESRAISGAERWDGDQYSFDYAFLDVLPKDYGKIVINLRKIPMIPLQEEKWSSLLDKYNIEIIVHETTNIYSATIYPIVLRLVKDNQWKLVYSDGVVLIFVRDISRFKGLISQYELDKIKIYDQIGMENAGRAGGPQSSAYSSLALALLMKGSSDKKVGEFVRYALYMNPRDFQAHYLKAFLEMKKKKG